MRNFFGSIHTDILENDKHRTLSKNNIDHNLVFPKLY